MRWIRGNIDPRINHEARINHVVSELDRTTCGVYHRRHIDHK